MKEEKKITIHQYPMLIEDFKKLQREQLKLFIRKQNDYGPRNISKFGEGGILVRSTDKIERLIIATYSMIALLVRRKRWP